MVAPTVHAEPETREYLQWVVRSRHDDAASWWQSWAGEKHDAADAEAVERNEIEAHHVLDRVYGSPGERRLLRIVERFERTITEVKPIWEESA